MARIDGLSSKRRPKMLNEDVLLGMKLIIIQGCTYCQW